MVEAREALADDKLEGRQTGSEGYRKAAAYVVVPVRKGGPEAGRIERLPSERGVLAAADPRGTVARALVRDGKEDVLRFGDDLTINLAPSSRRRWRRRSCSPATGCRAGCRAQRSCRRRPRRERWRSTSRGDAGRDHRPACRALSAGGRSLEALKAAGAIGTIAIPNPTTPNNRGNGRRRAG